MSVVATAPPPPPNADSLLAETGWQALVLHDLRAPLAVVVGQMVGMLDELQALSSTRIPPPLRPQRTDLLQLVRGVASEYADRAPDHVFRVLSGERSLLGRYDRGRLERAFGNLFSNAVKYSPGGGEIAVLLSRDCLADGDWAVIAVRDRGLGIPAIDVAHVFDRFYRGGNVIGQIDGAGLGLASVHQVVEQHGGTVNLESRVGSGTTFTVRLPLYSQ
jgi:signal transduction histidine kinase